MMSKLRWLLGALGLAVAAGAAAQMPPPGSGGHGFAHGIARADFCPDPRGGAGDGPDAERGPDDAGRRYLHGLSLTDEQQDRIFDIVHEQSPKLRQIARLARRAREQLRELAVSDRYDEAQVKTLAETAARANAEAALLRAQVDHAVVAVLTEEQRHQAFSGRPVSSCGEGPEVLGHGAGWH